MQTHLLLRHRLDHQLGVLHRVDDVVQALVGVDLGAQPLVTGEQPMEGVRIEELHREQPGDLALVLRHADLELFQLVHQLAGHVVHAGDVRVHLVEALRGRGVRKGD